MRILRASRLAAPWTLIPLSGALVGLLVAGCGSGGSADAPSTGTTANAAAGFSVAAVLPPAADVGGGLQISIQGAGFRAAPGPVFVQFGGRVVQATVLSDVLLEAVVPRADAAGAVDLVLAGPTGLVVLPGGFLYLAAPPAPPVLTHEPAVGSFVPGLGGTRVDLSVEHFPPLVAPSVTLGGLAATNVQVLGPTRLRCEVPSGLPGGLSLPLVLSEGASQVSANTFFHQGVISPGDLTINEFLPDPGTGDPNRDGTASSAGDEFVELVSRLGAPVDLTGWTLSDATSVRHTFPNPTTLPALGSIVVFGGGNPTYFALRHASGHAQSSATGTLGLNNSADSVILRDPAGTVIAQVNYANADVSAGRSRTALVDGQSQPVPVGSVGYAFHDATPGAVGPSSPGVKVGGGSFP